MTFRLAGPLNVPMLLLSPTYKKTDGVPKKTFDGGIAFFGAFRSFGGTETTVNGLFTVENTATIDTWYRPDIKNNCRIKLQTTGQVFEILSVEDIQMRHQYTRLKVREIGGEA